VAKKKTMVDELIDGVKSVANTGDDAPGKAGKLYERVVPVPHADVYSELPFELVETGGEPTEAAGRPKKVAPPSSTPAKKPVAKKVAKAPARKTAKKKAKR